MSSKELDRELKKVFEDLEQQDLSVKEIDSKIKEAKKANVKISKMLAEDEIPGDPKNFITVPAKTLIGGALATTVLSLAGIGLLVIAGITATLTVPVALIRTIAVAFAPGKERLRGIRDINTKTIDFLEKLKAKKVKNESGDIFNELNALSTIDKQDMKSFMDAKFNSVGKIDRAIGEIEEANRKIDKALKEKDYATNDFIRQVSGNLIIGGMVGAFAFNPVVGGSVALVGAGMATVTKYTDSDLKLIKRSNLEIIKELKSRRRILKESGDVMENLKYMTNPINEYNYTHEAVWNDFLMDRVSEQIEMNRYISECCAISEGINVFDNLVAINEGVGDKIKEYWNKVKTFLKRVWAKFIERLTSFFTSNQHYLDKYKEIILKKPLKALDSVDMPQHKIGEQRIVGCTAPIMNAALIEEVVGMIDANKDDIEKAKEAFINKYLIHDDKSFADHNKEQASYEEFANKYFQGGDETNIAAGSLDLAAMYEFCRDFKKIQNSLIKDRDAIDRSFTNASAELDKIEAKKPASTATKPGDQQGNKGPSQETMAMVNKWANGTEGQVKSITDVGSGITYKFKFTGGKWVQESVGIDSAVYGTYFVEFTPHEANSGNNDNNGGKATGTGVVNTANSKTTTANNVKDGSYDAKKGQEANQDTLQRAAGENIKDNDGNEATKLKRAMEVYNATAGKMFYAKLNAIEKIRNNYMKILEYHIKYYVGNEGKAPNQAQAKNSQDMSKVERKGVTDQKAEGQ